MGRRAECRDLLRAALRRGAAPAALAFRGGFRAGLWIAVLLVLLAGPPLCALILTIPLTDLPGRPVVTAALGRRGRPSAFYELMNNGD